MAGINPQNFSWICLKNTAQAPPPHPFPALARPPPRPLRRRGAPTSAAAGRRRGAAPRGRGPRICPGSSPLDSFSGAVGWGGGGGGWGWVGVGGGGWGWVRGGGWGGGGEVGGGEVVWPKWVCHDLSLGSTQYPFLVGCLFWGSTRFWWIQSETKKTTPRCLEHCPKKTRHPNGVHSLTGACWLF